MARRLPVFHTRKTLTLGETLSMLKDAKVITYDDDVLIDRHGALFIGDDSIDSIGAIKAKWYRREDIHRLIGFRQLAKREENYNE